LNIINVFGGFRQVESSTFSPRSGADAALFLPEFGSLLAVL